MTFVPQDLDPAEFGQLEPLYQALLDRSLTSPSELEQWLRDASELEAVPTWPAAESTQQAVMWSRRTGSSGGSSSAQRVTATSQRGRNGQPVT